MRIIIYFLFYMVALVTYGQDTAVAKDFLSVYGNTTFTRTISAYKARVTIHSDEHLKNKDFTSRRNYYLEWLQKEGVDTSKFIEKKLEFTPSGYRDKGTLFEFTTVSAKEIKKLLSIHDDGITSVFTAYRMDIDDDTYDEIFQKALEDAERKAKKIAKRLEKKIGTILSVSESPLPKSSWNKEIREDNFAIQVVFELR